MYFAKVTCLYGNVLITKQVKIALAYGCENSLDNKKLLEYVHLNRNNNYMRIARMGEALIRWM